MSKLGIHFFTRLFCNLKITFVIILLSYLYPITLSASNLQENQVNKQEVADFFNIPADKIALECPQKTYGFEGKGDDKFFFLCLREKDKQKRCEVAIHALDYLPLSYSISFDVMEHAGSPSDRWHSFFQLHSFPDKAEKWRCPPVSLEAYQGQYRGFNRWDASEISKTLGYNCTEEGSSIQGRQILSERPIKYGQWQSFLLQMDATHTRKGHLKLNIENKNVYDAGGPNMFNDKKPPYIKLGIYKPAGWSPSEIDSGEPICIGYKRLKIETHR